MLETGSLEGRLCCLCVYHCLLLGPSSSLSSAHPLLAPCYLWASCFHILQGEPCGEPADGLAHDYPPPWWSIPAFLATSQFSVCFKQIFCVSETSLCPVSSPFCLSELGLRAEHQWPCASQDGCIQDRTFWMVLLANDGINTESCCMSQNTGWSVYKPPATWDHIQSAV